MDLKLDHHTKDGIEIVDAEGEIDVYTAPRLRELLIDLVNNGFYQLVVNMEKVEFLDSTGLGVLVGGLKRIRAHDGSLDLVCTQERILKIFRITGLTKVFSILNTADEAIAVRKPAQFRSEERVTGAAGRSLEQPPRIPIQIFLQDGEAAYAVEDAIRTVLRDFGVAIVDEAPPIIGSWYKKLTGQLKRATDSDTAAKALRAIDMQVLDRFQAGIDGMTGDAVAKLITALDNTSGAELQVGSVLLVKVEDTIVVRQLTQLEMVHWQRNPALFKDPAKALLELQRATEYSPNGPLPADATATIG